MLFITVPPWHLDCNTISFYFSSSLSSTSCSCMPISHCQPKCFHSFCNLLQKCLIFIELFTSCSRYLMFLRPSSYFHLLVKCFSFKETYLLFPVYLKPDMLFLIILLSHPSFPLSDEPFAFTWTQFWTPIEVYPEQILAGSTLCRWADSNADLFSLMRAQNLVPLS